MAHLTCVGAHPRRDHRPARRVRAPPASTTSWPSAGDPPADGSDPGGDFTYATELVELVRDHPGDFSVGVAAHPELHPRSAGDRAADRRFLAAKLELADFGITQFFFEADDYLRMVDELADLGCTTPVLPGIMPPGATPLSGLQRMATMNGSVVPAAAARPARGARATTSRPAARSRSRWPPSCARRLLDAGAPGLHLYALNRSESVLRIVDGLGIRRPG